MQSAPRAPGDEANSERAAFEQRPSRVATPTRPATRECDHVESHSLLSGGPVLLQLAGNQSFELTVAQFFHRRRPAYTQSVLHIKQVFRNDHIGKHAREHFTALDREMHIVDHQTDVTCRQQVCRIQ